MMFRCTGEEAVTLDLLCDGINQCAGGQDERNFICESKLYICTLAIRNVDLYHTHPHYIHLYVTILHFADKCRLPYYGDCDYTRECVTTEFGQNCGNCLPGTGYLWR